MSKESERRNLKAQEDEDFLGILEEGVLQLRLLVVEESPRAVTTEGHCGEDGGIEEEVADDYQFEQHVTPPVGLEKIRTLAKRRTYVGRGAYVGIATNGDVVPEEEGHLNIFGLWRTRGIPRILRLYPGWEYRKRR